jgi:hypothetical protein
MCIWPGPYKKCEIPENAKCKNIKSGIYSTYFIIYLSSPNKSMQNGFYINPYTLDSTYASFFLPFPHIWETFNMNRFLLVILLKGI